MRLTSVEKSYLGSKVKHAELIWPSKMEYDPKEYLSEAENLLEWKSGCGSWHNPGKNSGFQKKVLTLLGPEIENHGLRKYCECKICSKSDIKQTFSRTRRRVLKLSCLTSFSGSNVSLARLVIMVPKFTDRKAASASGISSRSPCKPSRL